MGSYSQVVSAFDVATDITGVASGKGEDLPMSEAWRFAASDALDIRHAQLARRTAEHIAIHKPVLVVIEQPLDPNATGVHSNFKVSMALIGGACIVAAVARLCGVRDIRFVKVETVRKGFIGRGRIAKGYDAQRQREVSGGELAKAAVVAHCRMLGWNPADHNAADALAAWSWGVGQLSPLAGIRISGLFANRKGEGDGGHVAKDAVASRDDRHPVQQSKTVEIRS